MKYREAIAHELERAAEMFRDEGMEVERAGDIVCDRGVTKGRTPGSSYATIKYNGRITFTFGDIVLYDPDRDETQNRADGWMPLPAGA